MHLTDSDLAEQRRHADTVVRRGLTWSRSHHDLVIGAADVADGHVWVVDGARSAAHWLADRLDIEACTVRDWIRVGRALRLLHASADAWRSNRLSYAKVRALVGLATPANESELLEIALRVPAAQLARAFAAWSLANEDHKVIERRHRATRSYRSRVDADGTITTTIRKPALDAAHLDAAVEAELMRTTPPCEPDGSHPSMAQQRCDAFGRVVEGRTSGRFELLVHCDQTGSRLPDGTPLTDHAVIGLLDQARLRIIIHDAQGTPVNASTARRRPTVRQQRLAQSGAALCSRCGSSELPELHHTVSFSTSRRTHTDELEQLCAPCHRALHRIE